MIKADLMKQSCTDCGFRYTDFVRYDPVPNVRLDQKEGWMWDVQRKRRIAKLKDHEQRLFLKILVKLRENRGYYFTAYELKQEFELLSVSPVTRILKSMLELGIVRALRVNGAMYWKFEVTGYRNIKARTPKTKEEREIDNIREHVEIVEGGKVRRYVQYKDRDGETVGEFVWVTPETAAKIDEIYRQRMEAKKEQVVQ